MRAIRTIVIVAATLSASQSYAFDTAEAITELQNAPVTVFDLGMYTLKNEIKQRLWVEGIEITVGEKQKRQYGTGAGYNPDEGIITVFAIGIDYPKVPTTWNFATECDQIMERMRFILGYNPYKGELYENPSVIMQYFVDNYRGSLSGDIAEVTVLKLYRKIAGHTRECSGRLMSREIQVSD